ncbi:hypothetical protein [Calothrix sp. PCC 6303]|uniref:hypothetical protein n=1 Tax=Calothrix sp. PCC 6303 TaxID=1170562 RepID=UPI001181BEE5|nr:hypothetical protein [Calothrix sp. PCC 6303]
MQLPQSNCHSESESTNTASARIYCAISSVDEHNPEKLIRAIQLIHGIPKSNPLRSNSDRLMTQWSQALIGLSEEAFQQGDLTKAIELVEELPDNVKIDQQVPDKIKEWQSIWSEAEDIYKTAEAIMKEDESKNWYAAITKAKELKVIKNEYWSSTKYQQLLHHIQGIKEAAEKPESREKVAIKKDKENSDDVNIVATEQEKEDSNQLKKARNLARSGKINDMRNALMEASMVISDAHYQDARAFIKDLETKIAMSEDILYLAEAKKLASKKDDFSLEMAINEASLIGKERPLYKQASQHIETWKNQRKQGDNYSKSKLGFSDYVPTSSSDILSNKNQSSSSASNLETVDIFSSSPDVSVNAADTTTFQLEKIESEVIKEKKN